MACYRVNFAFTFAVKHVLTPGNGITIGTVTSLVYETESARLGLITGNSATRKTHSPLAATNVSRGKWFVNTGQPCGFGCARLWNTSGRGFITAGDTGRFYVYTLLCPSCLCRGLEMTCPPGQGDLPLLASLQEKSNSSGSSPAAVPSAKATCASKWYSTSRGPRLAL